MNVEYRLEPSARRVRALIAGVTVADSRSPWLMLGGYRPPRYELGNYGFPREDVRTDVLVDSPRAELDPARGPVTHWNVRSGDRLLADAAYAYPEAPPPFAALRGLIFFGWNDVDHWYEEDEEVWVHPRGPYHRVDVVGSSRRVRVALDGVELADSARPLLLYETGMPTRYYLPRADVRLERMTPTETHTRCPYKGVASYFAVDTGARRLPDLAWSYPAPIPECRRIRDHVCFFAERVDLELDGAPLARPQTKWETTIPLRDLIAG